MVWHSPRRRRRDGPRGRILILLRTSTLTVDPPIQLAVPGDAHEIAAMSRELIEYGLPWSWRAARVERAIADPETNVAVARANGGLLAFGIMEYLDLDAHLVLLAVQRGSRRAGIGSALLRWLEASAAVAGARRIRLEARWENSAARSFYNEHAYQEVAIRRGRYGAAVDGVQLEKWLRPPTAE